MKLGDYLKREKMTAAEFGRRVGVRRSTVLRWVRGERIPDSTGMNRIIDETKGAVRPNDFFKSQEAA